MKEHVMSISEPSTAVVAVEDVLTHQ